MAGDRGDEGNTPAARGPKEPARSSATWAGPGAYLKLITPLVPRTAPMRHAARRTVALVAKSAAPEGRPANDPRHRHRRRVDCARDPLCRRRAVVEVLRRRHSGRIDPQDR